MEKQKRIKPKLDRRNAVKNIDYDASYSPSSASFSTEGVTSFRIKGLEGEFELICRTLGFTGPEDFAIPTTVWEAQKARRASFDNSPSPSPQFQSQLLSAHSGNSYNYGANDKDTELSVSNKLNNARVRFDGGARVCADNSSNYGVNDSNAELPVSSKLSNARVRFCDDTNVVSVERIGNEDSVSERDIVLFDGGARASVCDEGNIGVVERNTSLVGGYSKWGGESVRSVKELSRVGGIVGERPPRILAPPPGMLRRPLVDNTSSTWDILKSFAPQDDDEGNLITGEGCSSGEDGRVIDENEEVKDGEGSKVNGVFPKPCSSLSNEDDHSNGSSVEDGVNSSIVHSVPITYPSASFRRNIFSWEKGELLGSGSFGTVYEGFTDDGLFFAVKEVSLLDQGSQGRQSILQLEQEISLLREFHHENIVRYLGTQKDETKLYIFLELATKGSLARLYQKYHLRDSVVSAYTRQILSGLKYLHDQNVIHRDIKCANILVDASGSVKLADFGLAKATTMNDIKSCKGTALWMAPEVVNLKNHGYGIPADIWSLGCTVLEMLTGQLPYSHLEGMQALYRIGKGELPLVPEDLSADARDFIFKCLQVNPANRPKAGELLDHPFVRRPLQKFSSPTSPRFF